MNKPSNFYYALCPKCTKNIPSLTIKLGYNRELEISCKCGYVNALNLNDYFENYITSKVKNNYSFTCQKHNKPYTYYNPIYSEHYCDDCDINANDSFLIKLVPPDLSLINKNIIKADKIIYSHFKEISDEAINLLKNKISRSKSQDDIVKMSMMINSIEYLHAHCKEKNQHILFLYSIIASNYNSNFNMNDFLTRYTLSIQKCNLAPEPEALIEYFQSYYIIKPFHYLLYY